MRYDPVGHRLDVLILRAPDALNRLSERMREMLPDANGTGLVLLADAARVEAAYENPNSLLWRDAGALLQTLFLTSTAFRLAFCPLGILGHEIIRALALPIEVRALGAAIVGRAPESHRGVF